MSPTPHAKPVRFETTVPILRVSNMRASLELYVNVLGFRKDWGGDPGMASVSRDRATLMLCPNAQGTQGTWVWIAVEDVERLHVEYLARGARIILPPTNFSWALEMRVEDADGHVLRFGSDPNKDVPYEDARA